MAIHRQHKSTNPAQTQTDLETHRYIMSGSTKEDKTLHSIDTKTIQDIEAPIKTGLQRHIARHNKTVLMQDNQ